MLIMSSKFIGMPVASIQAGSRVGFVSDLIIDPHKLKVIAFYVERENQQEDILFVDDMTDLSGRGIIIDHDDLLMKDEEDLVRLREITDMNFFLIEKPVETESGSPVGKVSRYALDPKGFSIMQLYVNQPMTVNLGSAEVLIHRKQIAKVTDKKVVVKDAAVKVKAKFGFRGLLFGKEASPQPDTKSARSKKT